MTKRCWFTEDSKARVALEALREEKTPQEIAVGHQVRPNWVSTWKRRAMDGLGEVFACGKVRRHRGNEVEIHWLHAKTGKLTVEQHPSSKGLKL